MLLKTQNCVLEGWTTLYTELSPFWAIVSHYPVGEYFFFLLRQVRQEGVQWSYVSPGNARRWITFKKKCFPTQVWNRPQVAGFWFQATSSILSVTIYLNSNLKATNPVAGRPRSGRPQRTVPAVNRYWSAFLGILGKVNYSCWFSHTCTLYRYQSFTQTLLNICHDARLHARPQNVNFVLTDRHIQTRLTWAGQFRRRNH